VIGFAIAVVSLAVITLAVLLVPMTVATTWRAPSRLAKRIPLGWPFGRVAWRGYVRVLPIASAIGGPGLLIMAWCFMLSTSINGHDFVTDAGVKGLLRIGVIAGFALMLVGLVVATPIFLFNRPSFLVPPDLRRDRGVLTEFLNSQESRPSSDR
jgi:hypothetical protein